jgi:GMP synthase (glutamine-hydrolysing)
MLARALGARVFRYDDKRSEIGYYAIEPTPAGERMCSGPFPRTVYQWHTDGFDLPGAPNSWPRAGRSSPTKRIAMAGIRSACNSTLK